MNLSEIVETSGWKSFMAKLYGWGASVVIIGALFKIQHWHGAGTMLTLGLFTEAIIFFFSAFEPLHEEVDWTLVYPELAGVSEDEGGEKSSLEARYGGNVSVGGVGGYAGGGISGSVGGGVGGGVGGRGFIGGGGSAALSKFDEMLEKAEITPELFQKLGVGMKRFSEATSNISAMGDISAASSKYMNTINTANDSLGRLSDTYSSMSKLISETNTGYGKMAESFSLIESGGKSYQQQLEALNKNLSALNTVYELQRKGADEHVKESDQLYRGVQSLIKDLTDSAGDTKKYREQIAKLNDSLTALNNVYGNMLATMNVK